MAERRATIPPVRALMSLGAAANVANQGAALALSADGELLAFVATPSSSKVSQLFVRRIAQLQATMLAGTAGARDPFFSPDGKWIGFFADGKLKKIAVTGGAVVALCDAVTARGGAWGDDGWIVFQPQGQGAPLLRVPSAGGTPQPLGSLQSGETTQRWPQILPGGNGVLYTSHNRPAGFDDANVVVQPLPDGAPKVVQRGAYFGRYVPSGHLLFVRSGTLFAVPFDLARLEISGDPVPVLDGLASTPTAAGVNGTGQFAVSDVGTLVYLPGGAAVERVLPVNRIDRTGKVTSLRATPSLWRDLRFAPDGRRLAMSIQDSSTQSDVWIYEWRRDAMSRLTFDPADDIAPVWTPDGQRIAFASRRGDPNGPANLY
jgi:WD40-like Beta Propeller Repeat